ncbi:MAG: outer membrane protein assembly factor BamD [Bacteroidota bacterium]
MKSSFQIAFICCLSMLLVGTACKSEFEQIRASGDAQRIYKKAEAYYADGDWLKAQTLYELVIGNYRGKKELEDIYLKYAYTYFNLEKYILSSYYFKNFSNTFTNSAKRQEADYMSAFSNYKLSPSFRLDQTSTNKAIDELQIFVNTYPNSDKVVVANELIKEMREKLERKAFEEAKLYSDLRQYQAATQSFENMLKDFPETSVAEEVRYRIIEAAFLLAENSIVDKQIERYNEVVKRGKRFLQRYPDSQFFNEVTLFNKRSDKKLKSINNDRYKNESAGTRR